MGKSILARLPHALVSLHCGQSLEVSGASSGSDPAANVNCLHCWRARRKRPALLTMFLRQEKRHELEELCSARAMETIVEGML